jgi:hypothetical protein
LATPDRGCGPARGRLGDDPSEIPQPAREDPSEIAQQITVRRADMAILYNCFNVMMTACATLREAKTQEIRSEQRFSRGFGGVYCAAQKGRFAADIAQRSAKRQARAAASRIASASRP